jgi:rubrerythrin
MSYEQLKNILDWNKEQEELHPIDKDLENNICPYCDWPLAIREDLRACPICERTFNA